MRARWHAALLAGAVVVSCSDPYGPLRSGHEFFLTSINNDPLPWVSPVNGIQRITDGWIKIDGDSAAERHEKIDGVVNGEWTYLGSYRIWHGMLIIKYVGWQQGNLGPYHAVDTFYVLPQGLVMRETGFIPPLDSIVRFYLMPLQQ